MQFIKDRLLCSQFQVTQKSNSGQKICVLVQIWEVETLAQPISLMQWQNFQPNSPFHGLARSPLSKILEQGHIKIGVIKSIHPLYLKFTTLSNINVHAF